MGQPRHSERRGTCELYYSSLLRTNLITGYLINAIAYIHGVNYDPESEPVDDLLQFESLAARAACHMQHVIMI